MKVLQLIRQENKLSSIFLQNEDRITFICILQILSNHELTRLKKFVSQITDKLYN